MQNEWIKIRQNKNTSFFYQVKENKTRRTKELIIAKEHLEPQAKEICLTDWTNVNGLKIVIYLMVFTKNAHKTPKTKEQ